MPDADRHCSVIEKRSLGITVLTNARTWGESSPPSLRRMASSVPLIAPLANPSDSVRKTSKGGTWSKSDHRDEGRQKGFEK